MRLVQPRVSGDDRGGLERNGFKTAIDFARYRHGACPGRRSGVTRYFHRAGKGALQTAGQRSQHLARLVAVIVNRLFAKDDKAGLFFVHDLGKDFGKDFGNDQRLNVFGNHKDCAVRTHRKRGPQRFLRFVRPDGHGNNLCCHTLFAQTQRFFDRDFVKRVHAHFDIGKINTCAIGFNPRLYVLIYHPFYGDEDLHGTLQFRL